MLVSESTPLLMEDWLPNISQIMSYCPLSLLMVMFGLSRHSAILLLKRRGTKCLESALKLLKPSPDKLYSYPLHILTWNCELILQRSHRLYPSPPILPLLCPFTCALVCDSLYLAITTNHKVIPRIMCHRRMSFTPISCFADVTLQWITIKDRAKSAGRLNRKEES